MGNGTSIWPPYYPLNVPPAEAIDTSGTAFRLVRSIPPAAIDFRSTFEDYKARGQPLPTERPFWQACGTSLHTELEGSRVTRARFPPLRERRIVVGQLAITHGKMMSTAGFHSSHITVWFRVDAAPETSFTLDAEATT